MSVSRDAASAEEPRADLQAPRCSKLASDISPRRTSALPSSTWPTSSQDTRPAHLVGPEHYRQGCGSGSSGLWLGPGDFGPLLRSGSWRRSTTAKN
jgi:hypothetical protein